MRKELKEKIAKELIFLEKLKACPNLRLQGSKNGKHVIGIVQDNYNPALHHAEWKYFDSYEQAYNELV